MATAYEVDQWKDRCRMLVALLDKSRSEKEELTRRIRDNSEEAKTARAIADGLEWEVEDLKDQNAKLRACLGDGCADCAVGMGRYADSLCDPIKAENEKLRDLVRDMWRDGMCDCDEQCTCAECCEYHYHERMRELGIEVTK